MRIAIVDDEPLWRDRARKILEAYFRDQVISLDSYESGRAILETDRVPDLIFMDVEMPEINGFDTVLECRRLWGDRIFIMLTAHGELWGEGYRIHADRYIRKEEMEEQIPAALDELLVDWQELPRLTVTEKGSGKSLTVSTEEIRQLESQGREVILSLSDREVSVSERFGELEAVLPEGDFCKIHRCIIVNLRYVQDIQGGQLIMTDGRQIAVSRRKLAEVKLAFLDYHFTRARG